MSPFFPMFGPIPLSIALPLVNTSSANSSPAASRPSPPPLLQPSPAFLPRFSLSHPLFLPLPHDLSLSFLPTPTRRHRAYIPRRIRVFISHYVRARALVHISMAYVRNTRVTRGIHAHSVLASDVRGVGEECKRHRRAHLGLSTYAPARAPYPRRIYIYVRRGDCARCT